MYRQDKVLSSGLQKPQILHANPDSNVVVWLELAYSNKSGKPLDHTQHTVITHAGKYRYVEYQYLQRCERVRIERD